MPRTVRYFFAFQSPFAALADGRVDALVAETGAVLDPVPVVPPPQPEPTGVAAQLAEFKVSYLFEDAARWAARLGVPWHPPESRIVDATDAAAGYYFARTQGKSAATATRSFVRAGARAATSPTLPCLPTAPLMRGCRARDCSTRFGRSDTTTK